jgi:hypothetical protein
MSLVIEDGSGLANAQSYVTIVDVANYAAAFGLTPPTSPNAAIMTAMRYLEGMFYDRWVGVKKTENQALSWPRAYATKRDGWAVPESTIPNEVKNAVCALAIRVGNGEDITPDITAASKTKKEQIGPIMVEYADFAPTYPTFVDIEFTLKSVVRPRGSAKVIRT